MTDRQTLVLGIGNTLLSDEGFGVHMIDYLSRYHPRVAIHRLIDGGTLSFTLATYIENAARLIVIDAAMLDAPAGTVQVFEGADMDRFTGRQRRSVHEVSLADLLSIAHLTGHMPVRRALLAVQPQSIDWGQRLSDPLLAVRSCVAREVEGLLSRWDREDMQADARTGEYLQADPLTERLA